MGIAGNAAVGVTGLRTSSNRRAVGDRLNISREKRPLAAILTIVLLFLLPPGAASAAVLDHVGMFDNPVYVSSDPEDAERLLVAERRGVIFEVRGGGRVVWADLQDLVLCCEDDRGLLSIAPAPDFHHSGRVYVAYTGEAAAGDLAGDIHVDAFHHGGGARVRERILSVPHSLNADGNGGQLQFGPENALYASFGDGGGAGDPFDDAQHLERLLGKLIRIYPVPGNLPSYVVPADNPFIGQAAEDEIWSYGLRDPRRFSFDRDTGDMVISDVGQDAREEINLAPRLAGAAGGGGVNYGWDCQEGTIPFSGESSAACSETIPLTDPVFDYPHAAPPDGGAHGCSIVGGYVVRDETVPELYGRYLYGDYCVGAVRSIDLTAANPHSTDRAEPTLSVQPSVLTSFGEDSCGRLYITTRIGAVYRLVGGQSNACGLRSTPPPSATPRLRRPVVGLRAPRNRRDPSKVLIKARVRPCVENRGRRLILKRNGSRFARKRVRGRCVVKVRVRVKRRTSFRALLPLGRGAGTVRSRRVVVRSLER